MKNLRTLYKNVLINFVVFISYCIGVGLLSILPQKVYSQEIDSIRFYNPVNSATSLAIGRSSLYDTYLSPLKYEGTSFRLLHERINRTSWLDNRFIKQQFFEFEFASTDNLANTASEYWFLGEYRLGGHYDLIDKGDFRFRVGGLWNISAGVLYNLRNGNNPASARIYTNINLSAVAFYTWKNFTLRWQLDSPFIGMLFSPRFGQSYYEISLGNSVGIVNFASFHNQRALRSYLMVDYPVWKFTLRAGYLASFYQTKVHDIQTHTYSNSFVIGIVTESINISGAKSKKKSNWNSSYY